MMSVSESIAPSIPEDYFTALDGDTAVQEELEVLIHAARQEIRNTPLFTAEERPAIQSGFDEMRGPEDRRGVYPLSGDFRDYQCPRQHP